MTDEQKIERARTLFKDFHNRQARADEIVRLAGFVDPPVSLLVGRCLSIGYRAAGDHKNYYHEFSADKPPLLFVNETGEQAYMVGGVYRFTNRGFVR